MALFAKRPLRRTKDGRFDVNLASEQREVLKGYLDQLRDLLLSDDPLLRRLFPTAYPDDAERDAEYQRLMKGELIESRFVAIETMEATLDATSIDEAELNRWMQAINSLRLVVGTRLDVSEDWGDVEIDEDDPDHGLWVLYEILTWLLYAIVHALSEALPPPSATGPEI